MAMALGAAIESILTYLFSERSYRIAIVVNTEVKQISKENFKRHLDQRFWECTGVARQPVDPSLPRNLIHNLRIIAPYSEPQLQYDGESTQFLVSMIAPRLDDLNFENLINEALQHTAARRLACLNAKNLDIKLYPDSYLVQVSRLKITEIASYTIQKKPINYFTKIY